jgi:uncharacterized protein YecE (DUF72 family)
MSTAFDRSGVKAAAESLAKRGVFVGTSSWKYPGWRGQLYEHDRYVWHGKFSKTRFEQLCLSEYSEVFKTVCVDAAYYKFPDSRYLELLVNGVPDDFLFGLKVTDEITIKRFSNLPRFGLRAGRPNENFLNADLFASNFLGPCEPFKSRIGIMLLEFSKFHSSDYESGRDFAADLDLFLSKLPKGWPYAIEIRNRHFLHADYFAVLKRHNIAHVINSWADMPSAEEQIALEGSRTNPELCAARFLLKPGRSYEEAVKIFAPYDAIKEPNPSARAAGAALIRKAIAAGSQGRTFMFVNNRLEGNALSTIAAMIDQAGEWRNPKAEIRSPN